METLPCSNFHSSLYRHYWSYYAEIPFWIHEVRKLYSLDVLGLTCFHDVNLQHIRTSLDHVAQGGSFAEEVISTIRTAKAFGTQFRLGAVYDSHVTKSYIADVKGGMVTGIGIACFFIFVYGSYGLAFSYGTTLLLGGHGNVETIINVYVPCFSGLVRKEEKHAHHFISQLYGYSHWLILPRPSCT